MLNQVKYFILYAKQHDVSVSYTQPSLKYEVDATDAKAQIRDTFFGTHRYCYRNRDAMEIFIKLFLWY